jgi:peptidoglycan/LPS O-acetylase OafA/YrhL
VFGVMLFYLLYPLLYKWFKRLNHNLLSIIVAELVPLAILIVMQIACPTFYKHTEVATTRVFIFIFGAYLGKFVYEGKSMRFNMPLGAIAFAILLAINFIYFKGKPDLRFYYRVSYAPLSFLFVAEMSYILSRFKIGFLPFFGAITLELYLVHEKILWLLKQIGFFSNVHIKNLVSVALAIVVAYLLAFGEKRVARLFGKKDKAVAAK